MFLAPGIFSGLLVLWYTALCFFCSWPIYKKYGLLAACGFATAIASALHSFESPFGNWFSSESRDWVVAFHYGAAEALAIFLLTIFATRGLELVTWKKVFAWLALLDSAAVIIGKFFHTPYGFFMNPSMDGCFLACVWPLFSDDCNDAVDFGTVLTPIAIVCTGQSQPIALAFIAWAVPGILQKKWKQLLLAIALSLPVGFLIAGHDLFDPNGRVEVWKIALDFWLSKKHWASGLGLGSFSILGPYFTSWRSEKFLWLHSDWLQILFETGTIGAVLALATAIQAIYKARRNLMLCSMIVTYCAWMCANFPLRNPVSGVLAVVLLRLALVQASLGTQQPRLRSKE